MLHSAQQLHMWEASSEKERGGSKVQNRFGGQIFHAGAWQHSREAPKMCISVFKGNSHQSNTSLPPPPKCTKYRLKASLLDEFWWRLTMYGLPRVRFMDNLCSFCAEHSANSYDVAVEEWMLTCANTMCSQRLQAQVILRLKFPVDSHFMALRWRSCSPSASETTENQSWHGIAFHVFFFLLLIQIFIHLHNTHQSCRGNQYSKNGPDCHDSCDHIALFFLN